MKFIIVSVFLMSISCSTSIKNSRLIENHEKLHTNVKNEAMNLLHESEHSAELK